MKNYTWAEELFKKIMDCDIRINAFKCNILEIFGALERENYKIKKDKELWRRFASLEEGFIKMKGFDIRIKDLDTTYSISLVNQREEENKERKMYSGSGESERRE